jgi:hypothetical protein
MSALKKQLSFIPFMASSEKIPPERDYPALSHVLFDVHFRLDSSSAT